MRQVLKRTFLSSVHFFGFGSIGGADILLERGKREKKEEEFLVACFRSQNESSVQHFLFYK